MRKIFITLTAGAVMLSGVQLSAQSSKPVSLGIAAGAAIPASTLSDSWSTGYNGTIALGLSSVGSPLGLRFEGSYNKFIGRNDNGVFNQPDFTIIDGTANVVYALPGVGIRPYLIAGGGYYSLKKDNSNLGSVNKFGINGGVGAMFPLSGFNTYVEARVHDVFTDLNSTWFVPVTFGIMF